VPRAGAANNQLVYLKQEIYMDFVWVQTCTVYDCHSQGATENGPGPVCGRLKHPTK